GTLSRFRVGDREYCRVVHGRTSHYVGPCSEYTYVNRIFESSFGEHLDIQGLSSNNPIDNAIAALRLLRNPRVLGILARRGRGEIMERLSDLKRLVEEIESELTAAGSGWDSEV
ncbi:MAG: hypothetical protein QXF05_02805, partial [Thermofilaceae archaeon]